MVRNLGFVLAVCAVACSVRAQDIPARAEALIVPDAKETFVRSLTLRPERFIVDSSHASIVWLSQIAVAPYAPTGPVKLKLSLAPEAADAKPIKELATFDVYVRNFVERPYAASVDLTGVADGNYRIVAEVIEGDATLATLQKPVVLAAGIDSRQADVENRLAKIQGHDSTKATIRYPFDFARVINIGKRNWNAADLGIDEKSQPNYYNFSEGLKHSESLLAALEKGQDPLWQAKGDLKRHYWMPESGEILPYRVYVPPTWDGKSQLPMVFILHGNTRNQDFYFDRNERIIPKTADKHGFMLVGVFGYYPNGGYNSSMLNRGGGGAGRGGEARGGARGGGGGRGGNTVPAMNGMPQSRIGELSEIDTMHVYELVKKEYPIDPKRTFLYGFSAGGSGAYYLGPKHAENWAAIALGGAGNAPSANYPFARLKSFNIPVFIFHGDQESAGVMTNQPLFVNAMKENGIDAQLKVYPGVTHDGGPAAGIADVLDFFAAHPRK